MTASRCRMAAATNSITAPRYRSAQSAAERAEAAGHLVPDLHIDSIKVKTRDFR
jgi:hypothetical protein